MAKQDCVDDQGAAPYTGTDFPGYGNGTFKPGMNRLPAGGSVFIRDLNLSASDLNQFMSDLNGFSANLNWFGPDLNSFN